MAKSYSGDTFNYQNQITTVSINGVLTQMTVKEYNAYKAKITRQKQINERNSRLIPMIPSMIAEIMKELKLCKSLEAYYHNGYRQWGVIINDVIKNPLVEKHFIMFISKYNDVQKQLELIAKVAKKNDKDIFSFIEKLYYLLDDMGNEIVAISEGMIKSGILTDFIYKGKECIYGNGRRLGIKELVSRTTQNTIAMKRVLDQLSVLVNNGSTMVDYIVLNGKKKK